MNILIVDDDYVDREHVKRTLHKGNSLFNFSESESVNEGLALFRSQRFDCVLLDYRMPQRNGLEMLNELRRDPMDQSVAIIMLSNSEDEELALSCIRAGAQDFLLKSEISRRQLMRAIIHSQERFKLEQKLYQSYSQTKQLAERDPLTGLANRLLFERSLKMSMSQTQRNQLKVAVLLFDIDHFKNINDSHGHDIGDLILKKIADRIDKSLRGNELLARLGGDEFAIVLDDLKSDSTVGLVARRILSAMDKPFHLSNLEIKASISIGISIHPDNSVYPEELFKYADIALYRAKKLGRNRVVFFEEALQEQFLDRYNIELQLKSALTKDQFFLHYQPVFEPQSRELTGVEALIRWQSDDGLQSPEKFISIAEETGHIVKIGRWVIESAMSQLSNWREEGYDLSVMSINLSAIQLTDNELVTIIQKSLSKYHIEPKSIEFELTETALIEDSVDHSKMINDIHHLGCRIALDDFGTGFSSISHIHNFPIDTVKIDKSLMQATNDNKSLTLVRSLAAMLHSLKLNIVAEGIETKESLQLCCELGIHRVQGYYLSRPVPANEIQTQFLAP